MKPKQNKRPTLAWAVFVFLCITAVVAAYFYFGSQGRIYVHFIDVGQGEATLIQTHGGTMLIDGGDNHMGETTVNYLLYNGVYFIDYLIATHPHADHIGGLIPVLDTFAVGTLIMPNREHTTLTFERFLDAIERNNIYVREPVVGAEIRKGGAVFTIVAPNSGGYTALNDYSIVMHMVYRDISFLFTGDAEAVSEREILAVGHNISADILQVGHHGSRTSTTYEFLREVSPLIAVISAGSGNAYGHPHASVINRLYEYGVIIYRTDHHGNVVIATNGRDIWVN